MEIALFERIGIPYTENTGWYLVALRAGLVTIAGAGLNCP